MAAKRIYQIAKEFEREEKEIIEFLTAQGIKVGNRLSAVSDDIYSMLKAKYTAPPEPPPAPEPPPEPEKPVPAQQPDAQGEQVPGQPGKKKKKKNKNPQGDPNAQSEPAQDGAPVNQGFPAPQAANPEFLNAATQAVYREAIEAGNKFIDSPYFSGMTKKEYKAAKLKLSVHTDTWAILCEHKSAYADSSPANYWQGINKLTTKAFKLINNFGMEHREALGKMRDTLYPVGLKYNPREIFTDEENQLFEEQQKLLFRAFGHGIGAVNDRLFDLKMYAERMKAKFEHMDFVDYMTNPEGELNNTVRKPFNEMAEMIAFNISGIARRFVFFMRNEERIVKVVNNFSEWLDGYAKLKSEGADAAKVEKYLYLEKKFIELVDFMSFDNLLYVKKNHPKPFDTVLDLLNEYRDNIDDPDAERNFKYKVRGVTNVIYKPKEYVFLYQFADLEPNKDYRPPEEIAAAKAKAEADAKAKAEADAKVAAQQENPADDSADEA